MKSWLHWLPKWWAVLSSAAIACNAADANTGPLPMDDGYRGIWYFNQPTQDEYRYKYSGGMATYPQQHAPIAIYAPAVEKTFFVYGGTTARAPQEKQTLLHMVSYYDHKRGAVPKPRILLNKQTDDAHDNPVLSIDGAGHLWIFSPAHGAGRASYIHRSIRPYDITEFSRVLQTNFSYPQPWYLSKHGFVFLHTRYGKGALGLQSQRNLGFSLSKEGFEWTATAPLAGIALGDYQISWPRGDSLGTAFDYHPAPLGLNARANIYFIQTSDGGNQWSDVSGAPVVLPLTKPENRALVYDSRREGKLVYLKDLNYDAQGHPVILFLTSHGFEPGPKNGPRQWKTARWTGASWEVRPLTTSGNNYDHGSLYIEPDGNWRVIAPTLPGPQPGNPGGEMAVWLSKNRGESWTLAKQLTRQSTRNHGYARRPLNVHPEFYALWADGDARKPSDSFLYFTDRDGTHVGRLPQTMTDETAKPDWAW